MDEKLSYFGIIGIVAIVAIVALITMISGNGGGVNVALPSNDADLSGGATKFRVEQYTLCYETDLGNDPYSYGIATLMNLSSNQTIYTVDDYCENDGELTEYFCVEASYGDFISRERISCNCVDGECQENIISCYDTDGGIAYYERGYLTVINESSGYLMINVSDECSNSRTLKEYYCYSGPYGEFFNWEEYNCPGNCVNGECIEQNPLPICTETDKGDDRYNFGVNTVYNFYTNQTIYNETDYCANEKTLVEYVCTKSGQAEPKKYECPCNNGACRMTKPPVFQK